MSTTSVEQIPKLCLAAVTTATRFSAKTLTTWPPRPAPTVAGSSRKPNAAITSMTAGVPDMNKLPAVEAVAVAEHRVVDGSVRPLMADENTHVAGGGNKTRVTSPS
jgi:hypothetical protein